MWQDLAAAGHRVLHRDQVSQRLLAKFCVMLIGDGIQERRDAAFFVFQPKIGGGDDRRRCRIA